MKHPYKVTITLSLLGDATLEDAEIDDEKDLGDHEYVIHANSQSQAREWALDQFHDQVAIGCLDYVEIDVEVEDIS